MLAHFLDGTIDNIPFSVTVLSQGDEFHPIWDGDQQLNAEQQDDVIGEIGNFLYDEREARIHAFNNPPAWIPKTTDPDSCANCGRKLAPAHYVACDDCHQLVDPAYTGHMCVERRYRLQTTPRHAMGSSQAN